MFLTSSLEIMKETLKNFLPFFFRLWWLWVLVLAAAVIRLILSSPRFKGKAGEKAVIRSLAKLPDGEFVLLNDLLLPAENGTSQIDHIVLSGKGLFVIETKNYSGIISGSEKSSTWTQNIYGNKKSFKNPVYQNYGHIKTLEKILAGFENIPYYSIVAFPEKAKLNVKSEKANVVFYKDIANVITKTEAEAVISSDTIQAIKDKLLAENIVDNEMRKAHNIEAHQKKTDAEQKVKEGICPQCGEKLVVRNGKNGKFYGCSAYPKCHYTHSIE